MRILRPLARKPVALLWGGLATSSIGDQAYIVAIAWIGVAAFGPRAGWLTGLGAGCVLVTALFSGPWIDRYPATAAMVVSDLARAASLAMVAVAWMAGTPLAVWASLLVCAVVVLGVGQGVFRPALQDVIPTTVADPAMLPAANALFDGTERLARLLGPGLIGLLSATLAPVHFLLLDAGTFLVSAACVRRIGAALPPPLPRPRQPVGVALLRGVRAARRHPLLGWQLLTAAPNNGTWLVVYYLALPLLVERHGLTLGGTSPGAGFGAYGLVLVGYGCTNLLGNLVVGSRNVPARPAGQIALGNACLGVGMAGLGLLEWVVLAPGTRLACYAGLAMVSAVGGPLQDIPVAVLRQTALPRADVPAAMRASMASSQGGALLLLATAPVLLGAMSLGTYVTGCGAVMLAVGGVTFLRRRVLALPPRPPPPPPR